MSWSHTHPTRFKNIHQLCIRDVVFFCHTEWSVVFQDDNNRYLWWGVKNKLVVVRNIELEWFCAPALCRDWAAELFVSFTSVVPWHQLSALILWDQKDDDVESDFILSCTKTCKIRSSHKFAQSVGFLHLAWCYLPLRSHELWSFMVYCIRGAAPSDSGNSGYLVTVMNY